MPLNPLHRLPNGEWVDLLDVSMISPAAAREVYPDRVVVVAKTAHFTFKFASFSDASSYADQLAAFVNEARSKCDAARG